MSPYALLRRAIGPSILLTLATLSQVSSSAAQQGIGALSPLIQIALHLSLTQMGLLVSAISLGMVVGQIPAGIVVDRRGARWLIEWGGIATAVVAVLLWRADTFAELLLGLFLFGLMLGPVPTGGMRAVFNAYAPDRRGFAMGVRQAGVPVGSALSAACLPAAALAYGVHIVWLAFAALILGTSTLFAAFIPAAPHGSGRLRSRDANISGAISPMLIAFVLVSTQWCALAFVIVYLHAIQAWPYVDAGLGLAMVQVGGGISRVLMGWWSDRIGRRGPLIVALAAVASFSLGALAVIPHRAAYALVMVILFSLGVGGVGWNGLTITWAGERVPASRAGQAMSWTTSAAYLGASLYPPAFGAVVDITHRFAWAWAAVAGWVVIGGITAFATMQKENRLHGGRCYAG